MRGVSRHMAADHKLVLRRVGWTLVIVGALDIGYMVYCVLNQLSYTSSFNIFAVVAGIYLVRGHLGAARVVTWFAAFYASGFLLAAFLLFPWLWPLEFWRFTFVRSPSAVLFPAFSLVVVVGLMLWVYSQLRSPTVVRARETAGQSGRAPLSALLAASVIVLAIAVLSYFTSHGESAERAVRLAAAQYGTQYRYFVSGMSWSGRSVRASLVAYNEQETKDVEVEWEE